MKARKTRHPKLLVETLEGELTEVHGFRNLVAWLSKDGVDVEYDGTRVLSAYRRADAETWELVDVPTLVGLLEHEPGVRFWTKDTPPNYGDSHDEGWEEIR